MTIRLHDSMKREKVEFAPKDPNNVRMYVCGPTVYDRAHIGNARPVVVFDVLYRLLRHVYGERNVTYVRNVTDIDDKIMNRAAERGVPIETVTAETYQWFQDDMAALGCLPPDHQPRATEHVPGMIAMIEALIAQGAAYAAEGHVLFEVAKFPDYGRLSGRSVEDMIAGARVEVAPYKRDPMDFVLWKPSDDGQPGWDGPQVNGKSIGRGRPGWHIECSAMSRALLGGDFDIHGGGADLMFPHHENEIAQSRCAHPGEGFAGLWMHNGMVLVGGKKMSKSLGNFLTVEDMRAQAPGEVLRLALLMTHYRDPLDWNKDLLKEARRLFDEWSLIAGSAWDDYRDWKGHRHSGGLPSADLIDCLSDDLNTHEAIGVVTRSAKKASGGTDDDRRQVISDLIALGVFEEDRSPNAMMSGSGVFWPGWLSHSDRAHAEAIGAKWHELRIERDFAAADTLRETVAQIGVELRATQLGPDVYIRSDVDVAKLRGIVL